MKESREAYIKYGPEGWIVYKNIKPRQTYDQLLDETLYNISKCKREHPNAAVICADGNDGFEIQILYKVIDDNEQKREETIN